MRTTNNPLAPDWLKPASDANAFSPKIWPDSLHRNSSGEAELAGITVSKLAEEYGTPLYLYDLDALKNRAIQIKDTFEKSFAAIGAEIKVYYAGKAFLSSDVVRIMLAAGLNIDVASGGELALALQSGASGDRLGLHGNNKSDAELTQAVKNRVRGIVIDHRDEIAQLARIAAWAGVVQPVRLRVRNGIHAHTHEYLSTAHEDQKFGVSLGEAPDLVAEIRKHPELEFLGLHAHIGSQIFGAEGFAASATKLAKLHVELAKSGPVPEMNLGGGFGIAYTAADNPDNIADLAVAIAAAVRNAFDELGYPELPKFAIEPGRWIAGPAGVTLYRLGAKKDVQLELQGQLAVRRYLSVDGGMSDNARPALYGADYTANLANRSSKAEQVLVRVAGKHCESGDIVVNDAYLPGDAASGDLLLVAATGAYCWALASNYNFLGRPAVVGIQNGKSRVMVRGERIEDLLNRDQGLARSSEQ